MDKSEAVFVVLDYFIQTQFDTDRAWGMIAKLETTQDVKFSMKDAEMFRDMFNRIKNLK